MAEIDISHQRDTDHRLSFVDALNQKYSCDEPLAIKIHVAKSAPGKTDHGDLIVPEHLALNYCRIDRAGQMMDITNVMVNVCELDLSNNFLSQWSEVFQILLYLPKIRFLNLSNNPLNLSGDVNWTGGPFTGIKQLVLNAVKVSWNTVRNLLLIMPEIQEIHLSLNEISAVEVFPDHTFPKVSELYVNGNSISHWTEAEKLGNIFPNLTNLVMMDNPLDDLTGDKPCTNFSSLVSLNLRNTKVTCWTELQKLKAFPCLTDVRVHGIPFLDTYEEKLRRCLLIGYLPNVTRLNGSPVTTTEREDAERAFIRFYMNTQDRPSRYDELVAVYGHLEPLADIDLSVKDLVTVTVHYMNKSQLKTFNLRDTALDVKKRLAKELVHRPYRAIDIYHHDVGSGFGHNVMSYLQRSLLNYRVKDGDEFYVELRN